MKVESVSSLPIFPFIDKAELGSNTPEAQLFFGYANFIMQYIHIQDYESDIFQRFVTINVGSGINFNGQNMSVVEYKAITASISVSSKKIDALPFTGNIGHRKYCWVALVNPPMFGPKEVMKGKYIVQAFTAQYGLLELIKQMPIIQGLAIILMEISLIVQSKNIPCLFWLISYIQLNRGYFGLSQCIVYLKTLNPKT